MESARISCCNERMEDYRAFAPVTVLERRGTVAPSAGSGAFACARFDTQLKSASLSSKSSSHSPALPLLFNCIRLFQYSIAQILSASYVAI